MPGSRFRLMGGIELIIIGVAAVAIAAAVGAFTIAFRRAEPDSASLWPKRVERRARLADRSTPAMDLVLETSADTEDETDEVEEVVAAAEEVEREEVLAPITETQVIVEASPEEVGVTRRQFFNRSLAAMSVAWFGIMGIEILAFLWPKISGGFGSDVDAGNAAELIPEMTDAAGLITPAFIPDARAYVVPAPVEMSEQFRGQGRGTPEGSWPSTSVASTWDAGFPGATTPRDSSARATGPSTTRSESISRDPPPATWTGSGSTYPRTDG